MNLRSFVGSMAMVGAVALLASGCFATRAVRTDTTTSYQLLRAELPPSLANSAPVAVVPQPAQPEGGTLVVEALDVPAPPTSSARPERLPSTIARASEPVASAAPAPGWDPLPSYVGQFTGQDWHRVPIFGASAQSSSSFRTWGGRAHVGAVYGGAAYGGPMAPGAYGSASPHFSSAPSFSGSVSSHFAGGYSGSGF